MGPKLVPVLAALAACGIIAVHCTPYCTSYNTTANPGDPPLPDLPQQYQTTIEANILDRKMTVTAHEYFDNPGDRATLQIYANTTLHTLVFDYANDQLFYVSQGSCQIANLSTDDNNILFGDRTVKGLPHVFTSGGALHFAKQFGEKYMGNNETVRGIRCDMWRSCLYWPQLASNFTLDYYFTARDWLDPISTPQIPVRAHAYGMQKIGDGTFRNFSHNYDYIDFQNVISVDPSIFETPKGVVCEGRKLTKKVPQLPNFYHYRQEIIVAADARILQADVWYDADYRYVRYDYRTIQETAPLFTLDPITEIHDHNFGVSYIKNQVTGDCVSMPITNSSFDVGENTTWYQNGSQVYRLHMKDPMQLFYLDDTYAFTGQRTTRGLLCNVFTAVRNDYPVPGSGRVAATFEYYFLADGIHEYPDDGTTTPQDVPIYLEVNIPNLEYQVRYNFVDFDEEHPDISVFDVSSCFSDSAKLQFQVRFPGQYMTGTSASLSLSAQRVFRSIMDVSPLRVQDVRVDYDNSQLYVSATLIDRSPDMAQFTKLSGKEVERQDNLVYPVSMANNVSSCAKLCVDAQGFTCNSFDYCTLDPNGICHLSKAHIDEGKPSLVNSSKCDHYSRTVNGPTNQEKSIALAYDNLRQQIYSGGVELDIVVPGVSNVQRYVAVDIRVTFGWLNPKPVPSLTGQFSYHEEITIPDLKAVFNSHIYYDSDYQLVRYDMVNTQPGPPLFTVDPISSIHDYKSGLAYTLDKTEGNCTIAPISNTSFDVKVKQNAGFVVKMKSPLDIFYLNGTYRYAGQRTIRGMLCDVFEDHRTDFSFGNNPMHTESVFQFYFMSEMWNEMSEDNGSPVNSQPIALIISSASGQFTLTYNFYDFSEQHPDLSNFDIRPCYVGKQQRHFLIKFKGNYHPTLDTQIKKFMKSVQQMLQFITSASFLRFQDPQITYSAGYVYYLATMVEQAPYLLDFTKTTNHAGISTADKTVSSVNSDQDCAALCRKENTFNCENLIEDYILVFFDFTKTTNHAGISTADKTVSSINSDQDCAALCRKENTFNCMSFDYCPGASGLCLLRKTHNTQQVGPSYTCDHYSKTVDTVANVEPTVNEALQTMKNYVYARGLNISMANPADNSQTLYHAVLFDEDILRPDSQATTSVNLQHFVPSRQKVILKTIDLQLTGLSVDQCAARCLTEPTITCQSFDYCFDTGRCLMSTLHPDQNQSLIETHMMCDLYARSYLDNYNEYPGQTFQSQGDTSMTGIMSAQYCAKLCSENKNYVCLSFDYCVSSHTCILKQTHILDVAQSAIKKNSVCNHYSRAYIHDFQVTPGRILTSKMSLQFTNVSKDACAKLCRQNSGISFTFCQKTMVCSVYAINPAANRNQINSSATCDLYTLRSANNNGVPTNTKPQTSSSSSGYSSGAMAGLALAMLIPGMVVGAGLLYFCRTKRLVEEEQMRMGFVNMGHDNEDFDNPAKTRATQDDDEMPPAHLHEYDSPQ